MRRRRKQLQIVFQDPNSSLNPRMTVGQTLGEALVFHQMVARGGRNQAVNELLETVGLSGRHAGRYPNELSGGNGNGLASRAPWPSTRSSWFWTSQ